MAFSPHRTLRIVAPREAALAHSAECDTDSNRCRRERGNDGGLSENEAFYGAGHGAGHLRVRLGRRGVSWGRKCRPDIYRQRRQLHGTNGRGGSVDLEVIASSSSSAAFPAARRGHCALHGFVRSYCPRTKYGQRIRQSPEGPAGGPVAGGWPPSPAASNPLQYHSTSRGLGRNTAIASHRGFARPRRQRTRPSGPHQRSRRSHGRNRPEFHIHQQLIHKCAIGQHRLSGAFLRADAVDPCAWSTHHTDNDKTSRENLAAVPPPFLQGMEGVPGSDPGRRGRADGGHGPHQPVPPGAGALPTPRRIWRLQRSSIGASHGRWSLNPLLPRASPWISPTLATSATSIVMPPRKSVPSSLATPAGWSAATATEHLNAIRKPPVH